MWRTGQAFKFVPGECLICGFVHFKPEYNMLSSAKFWLDGWHVDLDLAVNFSDDLVVNDPSNFVIFLKRGLL